MQLAITIFNFELLLLITRVRDTSFHCKFLERSTNSKDSCVYLEFNTESKDSGTLDSRLSIQQRNKIIAYHCIKNMSTWTESNNALQKTFTFKSFGDAMAWMIKASYIIEKMDHHPEWTNIYNKVHVRLTTHDAGNTISAKDRLLATALDELV